MSLILWDKVVTLFLCFCVFFFKVAHFYNTVDQQMIPSQKPMMLDSALAFERLVKNPKAGSKEGGGKTQVTWDNPPELEAYIDKLQAAADKLTSENRRLRKCHHNISDKVKYVAQFRVHCIFMALQKIWSTRRWKIFSGWHLMRSTKRDIFQVAELCVVSPFSLRELRSLSWE